VRPTLTAGGRGTAFHLITPDNLFGSRLPNFLHTTVFKLVTPRVGSARLGCYLLDLAAGGGTDAPVAPGFESFLFGLEGEASLESGDLSHALTPGAFVYLPDKTTFDLHAADAARVLWFKRRYERFSALALPPARLGHRDQVPSTPTAVAGVSRQELLDPDDPRHDFNMSLLRFAPGASLGNVEIHDEEHGLFMTAGGGVYYLDGHRFDVERGDFIYMAPYCPQSFAASGAEPSEYLLYKDVYRDGF
jgi:(S)-ureidoglycine aminohydrolase